MQKVSTFPFTFICLSKLGAIYRPYAYAYVYSNLRRKWQPLEMVIDTGADYTLLPSKYVDILGIDLKKDCIPEVTLGIGGAETVYQHKGLKFRLGKHELEVPVGFLERNDVPGLLGRLKCLESFKITFVDKVSIFEI